MEKSVTSLTKSINLLKTKQQIWIKPFNGNAEKYTLYKNVDIYS